MVLPPIWTLTDTSRNQTFISGCISISCILKHAFCLSSHFTLLKTRECSTFDDTFINLQCTLQSVASYISLNIMVFFCFELFPRYKFFRDYRSIIIYVCSDIQKKCPVLGLDIYILIPMLKTIWWRTHNLEIKFPSKLFMYTSVSFWIYLTFSHCLLFFFYSDSIDRYH